MGILSKLFGNSKYSATVQNVMDAAEKKLKEAMKEAEKKEAAAAEKTEAAAPKIQEESSNMPWGPVMPKEENQFSFNGTYKAYFEKIFQEEFPELSFMLSHPQYYDSDIYSFTKGGEKKLVIELMKKSCSAQKLRRDTLREGVPYLRFYTDCSGIGWWNARSYVTGKMKEALGK